MEAEEWGAVLGKTVCSAGNSGLYMDLPIGWGIGNNPGSSGAVPLCS